MKSIFLSVSFLLSISLAYTQTFIDASTFGDAFIERAFDSDKDGDGNFYVAGMYSGTLNLGIDSVTWVGGNVDAYLIKYDSLGAPMWVKSFGGLADDAALAVTTDANNDVYVAGYFQGAGINSFDADPGPDTSYLANLSILLSRDIFIVKLNSQGDFQWARQISNTIASVNEDLGDIAIDNLGNLIVAGRFVQADFDPNPVNENIVLASGGGTSFDSFVLKLNSSGDYIWVKTFEGSGHSQINTIEVSPSNNIFIGGYYTNDIDMDPNAGTEIKNGWGSRDAFMLNLTTSGNYVIGAALGGIGSDEITEIQILNSEIYIGGHFSGTVDLHPDTILSDIRTSVGDNSGFVSKYALAGQYLYSYTIGGDALTDQQTVNSIRLTENDRISITGNICGTADFDAGIEDSLSTSMGASASYVLWINSQGEYDHHAVIQSSNSADGTYHEIINDNYIFMVGSYEDTLYPNPFNNNPMFISSGAVDVFTSILDFSGVYASLDEVDLNRIKIYPNPAVEIVYFKTDYIIERSELYSLEGDLLKQNRTLGQSNMEIGSLAPGVYLLKLQDTEGRIYQVRILKN